jgi:hypothetical protein
MEHRQGVEHDIRRIEIDDRGELVAVGQDIGVAEHDALGRAFGAGSEQHHRRVIRRCLHLAAIDSLREAGAQQSAEAGQRSDL